MLVTLSSLSGSEGVLGCECLRDVAIMLCKPGLSHCRPVHVQCKQQLEACTQKDPGAFHTSLDQLEQLGQHHRVELPCLTNAMVHKVLDQTRSSVNSAQLKSHLNFTEEFGRDLRGGVELLSHSSIGKAATLGMNPCHPYLPPLHAVRCSLMSMTMHVAVCFVQKSLSPTIIVVADDHET